MPEQRQEERHEPQRGELHDERRGAAVEPRAVLVERLGARKAAVAALERRDGRIALCRLATFAALVATGVAAFGLHRVGAAWIAAPVATFLVLLTVHDRALRALARGRRAVAFHEMALARLDEKWAGTGDQGERYASDDHPFARDLDLFGKGSLFELLCTTRTRPGADTLARWLQIGRA